MEPLIPLPPIKSTKTKTISIPIGSSSTKKSNKKLPTSSPLATLLDVGETMVNNPTPNLCNPHYSKPPTAASLRFARKLQKSGEKAAASSADKFKASEAGNTSSEDEILKQLPGGANNNKLRYNLICK